MKNFLLVAFLGLGFYLGYYFFLPQEYCLNDSKLCLTVTEYEMDQIRDNPFLAFKHAFNGNLKINDKSPYDANDSELYNLLKEIQQ